MRHFIFLALCLVIAVNRLPAQTSGILREVFTGIGGNAVSDLTNAPSFMANSPNSENVVTDFFEAPTDIDENYGQRMRALLIAPATGNYSFWIASDDNSQLFLSTNDQPVNRRVIASVNGWTSSREWTKEANQKSALIPLAAGQQYYIEALMKEGGGGDNLAVRWQLPSGTIEEPIPASRLLVYGLGPPQITQQPTNVTVVEGGSATFSVQVSHTTGMTYQWQRNSANIPGANSSAYSVGPVALGDNTSHFRCVLTNTSGSTNSNEAILTVQSDTTPPVLVSAVNLGDPQIVTVAFSEAVEVVSATKASNYTLNNGAAVLAANFADDARTIVLTTSVLSPGRTYTLTVNGVKDRATTPNTIAANSQKAFTLDYTPLDASNVIGSVEPIGPSSRRTGLIISEIMYHPTNRVDGKNLEFVELFNTQGWAEDLSGFRLTGAIEYTFLTNTTIGARSYLVVAPAPADVQNFYGISGVKGGFTNSLQNSSGTIRLRNRSSAVLLEAKYSSDFPYPASADGLGHSLVLARPSYGEGNTMAWAASAAVNGSPGSAEPAPANPYRTVVINEFLAHTDDPQVDFIELFNYGTDAVNLGGCFLSDDPSTNKFVIPAGVTIPPRGFYAVTQTQMNFSLSADGETIYLKSPDQIRIIDAVQFKGQENGVSTGRYPDGAPNFHRLLSPTLGTSNTKLLISDIVLNEIMYNPNSGDKDDEFVELYNRSANSVNLGGWKLSESISFTFPFNAVIPANGYVVVANNSAHLMTNYAGLNSGNTFGNYGDSLANRGARIALTKPDTVVSTNSNNVVTTNVIHITVDEVTYGTGGRWGQWSDGGGSSLESIDAHSDNRLASNWADSDESSKAPWTVVQFTGVLDNGNSAADSLQILLQGAGECLVDDVEVFAAGGPNLIANSNFENGATNWFFQGTHDTTTWETSEGYNSSRSLHVRATARGDTGANRVRAPLTSSLNPGTTATIRAKVRWLKGNPEVLLRLHGNWLEAIGALSLPQNPGTPGGRNSRSAANAGPAIYNVSHGPVLPAANQAVTVTAAVHDPDGLTSLTLKYRVDPATNLNAVSMVYNGAGIYSATIPGQPSGTLVAFSISARDNHAAPATTTFPKDAPARECLVRFGEFAPAGIYGSYRFWITTATVNRWANREKNSNEPLDATFVYGNFRSVYDIGTLYSGSPWHTPGYNSPVGNSCDYVLIFPADDLMLGAEDFVMSTVGNLGSDDTAQREQTSFWIGYQLGLPTNYRRYVRLYVNGQLRGGVVYEDSQQPSADFVAEWFPENSDGDLHKVEDWFEFDNTGDNKLFNVDATLQNFTTAGGAKKLARYRWNWRKRAVKDSANAYTNLFWLVDALNSPDSAYTTQVAAQLDAENWVRMFAMEHIVGNWDSYGFSRGKNMYAYKPESERWCLFGWDIDFTLGLGGAATDPILPNEIAVNDPIMSRFLNFPAFERAYLRALQDAVNGPLVSTQVGPMLDAKYNSLVANGITVNSPQAIKDFIAQRRSTIVTKLASVASSFTITSNNGNNFTTNKNYITLTGTAPVEAATIKVNGVAHPLTWSTINNWSLTVALSAGANPLTIQGYDLRGNALGSSIDTITVTYTGVSELLQDFLVINEIMYNPVVPDAGFIEIYNRSTNSAFDVSNFRLDGADFAFAEGTIIQPNGFLVVVKDVAVFAAIYGSTIPIAGVYDGKLDNGGETLKLVQPGATPAQDLVIDEVFYDDDPPWPTAADGFGSSLQLIDSAQDNNRVANWAAVIQTSTNASQDLILITSAWKYNQSGVDLGTTWKERTFNDGAWPSGPALLYIEDAALPAPKSTLLTFTSPKQTAFYFRTHFNFSGDPATATLNVSTVIDDGAVFYLNGVEVLRLGMPTGTISYGTFTARSVADAVYEGPFTISAASLVQGDNVLAVEVHQINAPSTDIVFGMTLTSASNSGSPYTPGTANSVITSLPFLPPLWLNEVQPNNLTGAQDRFGDRDPWVELYNSGTSAINLGGYYLGDAYTNLPRWAFPANTTINAGQFLTVWLDGEPGESAANELHANFRIAPISGAVALTKVVSNQITMVDYLNYNSMTADRSYGAFPDGKSGKRQKFYYATPAATNNNGFPAGLIYINEWMAGNNSTIQNSIGGGYDDWFELYNGGSSAVDLSGYTLTDNLADPTKYVIPPGISISAGGYLLFWADGSTNSGVHTNFKLQLAGDSIGFFAPNGTQVDAVTFTGQTNDVSQGRWPDGNSGPAVFMTTATPGSANIFGNSNNAPPVLAPIGNKIVNEGVQLSFIASATDPDSGQSLSYSLDPGAPSGAVINPSSGVFTWTPTENQGPANYSVAVRVTDNGSPAFNDFETITITVNEVNTAPTLLPIGNKSVNEGQTLAFVAMASDADVPAQILSFSLDVGAPPGASINPTNGTFLWFPTQAQGPGNYSATVIVTDNGSPALNASETIGITVNEVNSPPTLTPIGSKAVNEGSLLTFTISASDSDLPAQNLSYSLDPGAPAGANFNPATRTFTWTPTEAQGPSTNSVTFKVTDNGSPNMIAAETITITVNEVNSPPMLAPIGNKTVNEGALLSFTATASDSDTPTNTLTFSLDAGAPAGASIHPTTGALNWTPTQAQGPSTNPVTIRVTDNGSPNMSAAETINIVVNEVNAAPVLTPIGNRSVVEGNLLTFTVTATDPDGPTNALTFTLDAGAPSGATIHPTTGVFTWTPTEAQGPGTNPVTIRVTDNGSPNMSAAETINIVVNEFNAPPLLTPIGNRSVIEGNLLTFTVTATDPDVPINALTFTLDAGAPSGASIHPTTGVFIWTPTEAQGPSTNPVTIRVTDNGSPNMSAAETINIVVNEVNATPVLTPIGNRSVVQGNLLTFTVTATDADMPSNGLTFTLDAGAPSGANINPTTGVFTWTPTEAQGPSTNPVTIRVTDNGIPPATVAQTITVGVTETNAAPILAPIANKTINEGTLLTFTNTASDEDLPANTLTFSLDFGAPEGASIDSVTGVFNWTPSEAQGPGIYNVSVRVTDNGSPALNDAKTFAITVNEVNEAPVLSPIAEQTIAVGNLLVLTYSATDVDLPANRLTFSLDAGAPAGANVNPTNGVFTWTPAPNQAPSTNLVTVRVSDDGSPNQSDAKSFSIVVTSLAAIRLTSITTPTNDTVTITWGSEPGKTYRVEFNDRLDQASWNSLKEITATSSATTATNIPAGTNGQRYYRIRQLN